jgi:hypothetical protein
MFVTLSGHTSRYIGEGRHFGTLNASSAIYMSASRAPIKRNIRVHEGRRRGYIEIFCDTTTQNDT